MDSGGAKRPAIRSRRLARFAFEDHAHVFGVSVSDELRDAIQRQVRLGQQFFDATYSHLGNLLPGCAIQFAAKPAFQLPAGDPGEPDHLGNVDSVAGVPPDETADLRRFSIFDGKHLSRFSLHKSQGAARTPVEAVRQLRQDLV